jgi:hypothetical protein
MKLSLKETLRAFSIEIPFYAVLVTAYVFFALHFLGNWLFQLFTQNRHLYAAVALILIIAQGYLLELLSRALLGIITRKREK